MKYRRYPGDIGSSIANTPAFPQILAKFKAPLLVENAVKNGITMMYWTCLCIGSQGRYAIDVRDLPGADTSIVDQHSRAIQPAVQRAIALLLIDAAFPDLNSLVTWCDTHAEKLTDWTNKRPQHLHKSIFILADHAIAELHQLGYTVENGFLYPPSAGFPVSADRAARGADQTVPAVVRPAGREFTDGTRTLREDCISAVRDFANSRPEDDETWESWFEAAFDLSASRLSTIFDEHAAHQIAEPASQEPPAALEKEPKHG